MKKEMKFIVTFNVTMTIETEEERKESKTQSDTVQGSLNDFVEETKDVVPHGPWTKYPERKVHTCAQCGAPNRHNNPRKGGCVECRASDIFTDKGGLIE